MAETNETSAATKDAPSWFTGTRWAKLFRAKTETPEPQAPEKNLSPRELEQALMTAQEECTSLRTELHQIQSIQGATLERFRTTFYELPLPCFTVNDQANVIEWNRACENFFFLKEHEAVDRPISDILGSGIFRNDAEGMIYMVFLGLTPTPTEIELNVQGTPRKIKWFASPILNKEGAVVGALNTLAIVPQNDLSNQN